MRHASEDVNVITPVGDSSSVERVLAGEDIDLVASLPGTCQIRTSLDTLYTGDVITFGAVFSVQALANDIQIQAFEFNNIEAVEDQTVKIYGKSGSTFSSDINQWTEITTTNSVRSPDGLGAIVPRADMKPGVTLSQGQEWMFYFTLDRTELRMSESSSVTGSAFQTDDVLQLNVGWSIDGERIGSPRTENREFQGKIHYRVLTPCDTLGTQTELSFPFAAARGTNRRDLNNAVSGGFERLLTEEADLARWKEVYGLGIDGVELKPKGELDDCAEFGFESGCELYDSVLLLGHYESLDTRDMRLEFMLKLNNRNGLGELENELSVVYIGDEVFQLKYNIQLTGVPPNTILNPFQREYLERVTLDFLEEFSDASPSRVEISQEVETSSRRLRTRKLQNTGILPLEAVVFGIGDDSDSFASDLEKAFLDNTRQYQEEVQKRQFLPGAVNDGTNFGEIFAGLSGVNVGSAVPRTTGPSSDEEGGLSKRNLQILIFSIVAGLSFVWLVYRFSKDFVFVERQYEVKNEKLSEKNDKANAEELDNMDKPRQKPSKEKVKELHLEDLDNAKLGSEKGRKTPKSRGVSRAKSTDGADLLRSPKNSKDDEDSFGEHRPLRDITRGVSRTKSAELSPRKKNSSKSLQSQGSRKRGVSRTKSSEVSPRKSSSTRSLQEQSDRRRSVRRAKSSDGTDLLSPASSSRKSVRRAKSSDEADLLSPRSDSSKRSKRSKSREMSRQKRRDSSSKGRKEPSRGVGRSKSSVESSPSKRPNQAPRRKSGIENFEERPTTGPSGLRPPRRRSSSSSRGDQGLRPPERVPSSEEINKLSDTKKQRERRDKSKGRPKKSRKKPVSSKSAISASSGRSKAKKPAKSASDAGITMQNTKPASSKSTISNGDSHHSTGSKPSSARSQVSSGSERPPLAPTKKPSSRSSSLSNSSHHKS